MKNTNIAVWSIVLGAILVGGSLAPASASTGIAAPSTTLKTVSSTTEVDQACLQAVNLAAAQGDKSVSADICKFTKVLAVSSAETATVAQVEEARGSLPAADFRALQVAAAAGTVRSKSFRQNYDNVVVAWSQSGKFYYDGSRAWVTTAYRGVNGYHSCNVDRSIGYVIDIKKCDKSGSTSQRNLRAQFHSSVIPSGGVVNWSSEMHMFVNSAGKTWEG
jgi:hypothetical protein